MRIATLCLWNDEVGGDDNDDDDSDDNDDDYDDDIYVYYDEVSVCVSVCHKKSSLPQIPSS